MAAGAGLTCDAPVSVRVSAGGESEAGAGSERSEEDASAAFKAKVMEKEVVIQGIIINIERSLKENSEEGRRYLLEVVRPDVSCCRNLVEIAISPKYQVCVRLQCRVLRALQMMLRVAVSMVPEGTGYKDHPSVGMMCFKELATPDLAMQGYEHAVATARWHSEAVLACDALLVLGELGPAGLESPEIHRRLLGLFKELPDRVDELIDVALRIHKQGGQARASLLQETLTQPGGKVLCEVLLQLVNRGDEQRKVRGVKMLRGCLGMPGGDHLLYTNDARVLVELLLRELENSTEDAAAFVIYADCLRALYLSCDVVREHRREEVLRVLDEVHEEESNCEPEVRAACAEVLAVLRSG
eukprot:TRINITY_DN37472_c0_g1_i1.p1 TRINITY_DN37472_c0_g1~~TRINITY_DN37472_c0_g1_i1.p1  ORF type:complete len:356 (+),score=83.87 TRINITY_DN37472_c0_g1_i1:133-1200(+)